MMGKPTNPNSPWTEERLALLEKLWTAEMSASAIAARLNCGITRNAVCGMVHRLKLPKRIQTYLPRKPRRPRPITSRAPSKPSTRPNPVAKPVLARPMPVLLPVAAPVSVGAYIQDVTGCRHGIDWRDGKHLFCNCEPLWNNSLYCQFHHQLNHRSDGRL